MNTQTLISEAKARFNHNAAKDYLAEKYENKLIVAEQNGLWRADAQTIGLLNSFKTSKMILIDTFSNPVEVDRKQLLTALQSVYNTVMTDWHGEWKSLESKR